MISHVSSAWSRGTHLLGCILRLKINYSSPNAHVFNIYDSAKLVIHCISFLTFALAYGDEAGVRYTHIRTKMITHVILYPSFFFRTSYNGHC